jgi:hypothetical protein
MGGSSLWSDADPCAQAPVRVSRGGCRSAEPGTDPALPAAPHVPGILCCGPHPCTVESAVWQPALDLPVPSVVTFVLALFSNISLHCDSPVVLTFGTYIFMHFNNDLLCLIYTKSGMAFYIG